MALTPDQAKELRDMLREIEQLSIKLKVNINTTNLQDVEANAGTIKKLFKDLKEEWEDLTSGISIAAQGFRDVVKEISNQNIGLNTSIKAYKGLVSIADQIQAYQRGYNDLTIKDIANIRKKIELRKIELENSQKSLQEEGKAAKDKEKDLKRQLEYFDRLSQNNIKLTNSELSERKRINAELKRTQNEHAGITASMKQNAALLNDQDESFKNLELSVSEAARKINQEFVQNLDKNFKNLVKETQSTEDSIKKISKSFSVFESIAQKALDHQNEANELSEKDAKKLLEKLESERKRIIARQELLKIEHDALETKKTDNKLELDSKKIAIENLENEAKSRKLTKEELADLKKLKQDESVLLETQKDINSEIEVNAQATKKVSDLVKGQNEEYNKIKSSLIDIAKQSKLVSISKLDEDFKNLINDVRDTDQIFKSMSKSFKNLSGLFEKAQEYQENILDVNKEDVEELIKKVKLEMQSLTNQAESLKLEKERLELELAENKLKQQTSEIEINALKSKSTLTDEEKAKLEELETKKNGLLDIENEISGKIEANNKLTEKTQEYISGQSEEYQKLMGTLDEVENGVNNINKSFGLNIGKNLKGALGKAGLGNLANMLGIDGATTKMKQLTAQYTNNGKQALTLGQQFKVMGGGLSSMGGNLLKGFNPMMLALTGIVKLVQFFIEAMFEADQQVTDVAKSLNISKDAAREVRDRFFEISDNAKTYAGLLDNQVLSQKELVAANLKINELLGVSVDLSSQLGDKGKTLVAQFAAISKFLKLSEEEQKGLLDLQATSGKEVNDIRNSVLGTTSLYKIQSGVLLNERKVLENVLKASNAIKLSTHGGVEGLTKSAIEAAKLGLSLQKVSDIAGGLLDFESQIAAELEAELITGKDLNLELAQQAALNNDLATVASEISKNIGSAAEYSKMNRLEQESLAKAVGMTKDELADVLTTQENLNKLKGTYNALGADQLELMKKSGKVDAKTIELLSTGKATVVDYYKALQEAGKTQEEITELLGEQSYASLSAQTAQEKFNETLEKAKETFSRFVDGGSLDKLADFITRFVTSVNEKGLLSTLTGGIMSTSEVEALQSEKKTEDINQQIKEEEAKGDKADKSKLEDLKTQKQEISTTGARATAITQAQFKDDGVTGADVAKNVVAGGLPALMDLFSSAPSLEQRAQGETTYSETAGKYIDKLFGGSLGIEKEIEKDREAAQAQLEEFKKQYDTKFSMGGYTGDGGKDEIAGLVHKGEYVINQDQTKKYKPLLEKINNGEPLLDTTNDKGAALDKQILNANQNENKTSNIDIAKNIANVVDELSNVAVPTITPQPTTIETSTFNNTNKPSSAATNITSTTNTTNADNSAVIAAINKLAEVMAANGNKEIVMQMNGQTVGKVLTPIMSPMTVREINNTSVSI